MKHINNIAPLLPTTTATTLSFDNNYLPLPVAATYLHQLSLLSLLLVLIAVVGAITVAR